MWTLGNVVFEGEEKLRCGGEAARLLPTEYIWGEAALVMLPENGPL